MNGIIKTGMLFPVVVSLFLLSIHNSNAQPTITNPSGSGFTGEDSSVAAMTFTANPNTSGDESDINVNFCANTPGSNPTIDVKMSGGIFVTIPVGTDVTSIADHTIHYSATTGSAVPIAGCPENGTLKLELLILHNHPGPTTETWIVKMSAMGVNSRYDVGMVDASLTSIHLLPLVATTTSLTREERAPSETLGSGDGTTLCVTPFAPANCTSSTTGLTYLWSQTSGPAVTLPVTTNPTIQVLPSPSTRLPSVSTETTYVFNKSVSDNSVSEHGTLTNNQDISLTVAPFPAKDIMLVLDHSGSMLSENKWEITRQSAGLFIDLYRQLRDDDAGAVDDTDKSKIGHLKFESSSCGWGSTLTPLNVSDIYIGEALTSLDSMGPFQPVGDAYSTAPWGCTPIGDAIERAKNELKPPIDGGHGTPGRSNPVYVVMTDGLENSGKYNLADIRTRVQSGSSDWPSSQWDATFHTLAVGDVAVEESGLQLLSSAAGDGHGEYRKVTKLSDQDLQEFFVDILGDIIKAQRIEPQTGTPPDKEKCEGLPSTCSKQFVLNAGETRIAFVLLWDRSAPMASAYYPRLQHGATTITWNSANSLANVRKSHQIASADGYAFLVVDHTNSNNIDGTWTVDFADAAGNPQSLPADAHPRILAVVDPHLYANFGFDRKIHNTGDPIVLKANLREGALPVLGANVTVALVKPTEGQGTFLTENSSRYDPPGGNKRGDSTPKNTMFRGLLSQLQMPGLGTANGSIQLFDDGAHDDGAKNDGIYANQFTDTSKEGTYRFRFLAKGLANSKTPFSRTEIKDNYIGVSFDQSNSPSQTQSLPPQGGLNRISFTLTPRDSHGEYLGPYRPDVVGFKVTNGTAVGDIIDLHNGSYSQVIAYSNGQTPVVTPTINGTTGTPVGVAGGAGGTNRKFTFLLGALAFNDDVAIHDAVSYGLRLGFPLRNRYSIIGEFNAIPTADSNDVHGQMTQYLLGVEWLILPGMHPINPYINVVTGRARFDFDHSDSANTYGYGIGGIFYHTPQVSSLLEGRALWIGSSDYNSGTKLNYQLLWGLSFGF